MNTYRCALCWSGHLPRRSIRAAVQRTRPAYRVGRTEPLLTYSQAALRLCVCCQDIELMAKRGLIPVYTTSTGARFVRPSEIVRCLAIFDA